MRELSFILLIASLVMSGCRGALQSSDTKSFVGLNAELDESILRGEAPSFLYLQKWFNHELPVNFSEAQAGDVPYKVHSEFTESSLKAIPTEYRNRIIEYLKQQQDRVATFQSNLEDSKKINQLLQIEANEMADILMAFIEPSYSPKTNDLLAQLVAHKPLRNFIDRYSVELLEKLYARSQRSLVLGLERERDNFAKILSKTFVTKSGATPAFRNSLERDCAKLNSMLLALGERSESNCTSSAPAHLADGASIAYAARELEGPAGRTLGIFGSLASPQGYAASAISPKLKIFSGRDPNVNDPHAISESTPNTDVSGGGGGSGSNNNNSNGASNGGSGGNNTAKDNDTNTNTNNSGGNSLISALAKLLFGLQGNAATRLTAAEDTFEGAGFGLVVPPKPRGVCAGKMGLELVICQRYIETLPSSRTIAGDFRSQDSNFSLADEPLPSKPGVGYNFFMISKYATRVQNQGSEGACTAFGLAHALGILGKIKGKSGEYDARRIWQAQGQQPYMPAAIAAAKKMSFDGLRISKSQAVSASISSLKSVLDAGRPIYLGSDVDNSWNGASRGNANITCQGSRGVGHAYSIVGYDDASKKFIIKNSWGDFWGDQGYGYLSYSCVGRMNEFHFDVQLD